MSDKNQQALGPGLKVGNDNLRDSTEKFEALHWFHSCPCRVETNWKSNRKGSEAAFELDCTTDCCICLQQALLADTCLGSKYCERVDIEALAVAAVDVRVQLEVKNSIQEKM